MPDKPDKSRRKDILKELARQGQQKADAARPISLGDLGDLFDFLDLHMQEAGCDHTLTATQTFLKSRTLEEDGIFSWLREQHGYCDCEVLANVEESWQAAIQEWRARQGGPSQLPGQSM